jgi:hypothetical protein
VSSVLGAKLIEMYRLVIFLKGLRTIMTISKIGDRRPGIESCTPRMRRGTSS